MAEAGERQGETSWLSLAEIAERIGRPASTVYYWRRTYRAHIPDRRSAGGPVYPLRVFEEIAVLLGEGRSARQVNAALAAGEHPPLSEPSALADILAAFLAEARGIRAALERIADHLEGRQQTESEEPESRA